MTGQDRSGASTTRGAGSGASPECASNSVSKAGHSTPATPPEPSAAKPFSMTELIGAVSLMADRAHRRSDRKRLRRLVTDLCDIAKALRELEKSDV